MEVSWSSDLVAETHAALRGAICAQSRIGEYALSSLLYGLGRLGKSWPLLNPAVRRTLKEAIVTGHIHEVWSAQGVANSLHGLAAMQAYWSELSSSVRLALMKEVKRVAAAASESQLATILQSLSSMGLRWVSFSRELSSTMVTALERRVPGMNRQQLAASLVSLANMGRSWDSLPKELQSALVTSLLRVEGLSAGEVRLREQTYITADPAQSFRCTYN
jgi:hypothetical protein